MEKQKGFTLVELLVVISIIGLLASIVLVQLNGARLKARNAKRVADLTQISKALELYYNDNNSYPPLRDNGDNPNSQWRSQCGAGGGWFQTSDVIPGLVSKYISQFPADPSMNLTNSTACYLYTTWDGGVNYKVLDHDIVPAEGSGFDYNSYPAFIDPDRDGGPAGNGTPGSCVGSGDGSGIWSWAVFSPGAQCW